MARSLPVRYSVSRAMSCSGLDGAKEDAMNTRTSIVTAALLGAALLAPAAGWSAITPQQQRMKDCNADASAKSLKGPDRSTFMKTCLAARKESQQEKMKTCNQEATAKSLKGYDRKHFMSTCLSGH